MKNLILFWIISLVFLSSCNKGIQSAILSPNSTKILDQMPQQSYEFTLRNNSFKDLDVQVVDRVTGEFVSGFGLGKKAKIYVSQNDQLIIKNNGDKKAKVSWSYVQKSLIPLTASKRKRVSFTLHNSTSESIPLIIPTVMNPNLSPNSDSGVSLNIGQKVFFKKGFKKYLLLQVDNSIKEGSKLDVAQLLVVRKKELGI